MQIRLRDAIVTHAYANSRDQIDPGLMTPAERARVPPVRWRMTWRNPVNDRTALYIASHAYAIEGMGESEARALLAKLIADATRPEYTYRHRWRPGDVIMWDNRALVAGICTGSDSGRAAHRPAWAGDSARHFNDPLVDCSRCRRLGCHLHAAFHCARGTRGHRVACLPYGCARDKRLVSSP